MNYTKIESFILKKLTQGLSKTLHYHGVHHTLEVLKNVLQIAEYEGITGSNLKLLKLAALLHDIGFLEKYTGHEEHSCELAREILKKFEINESEIQQICHMIMATKIPQMPKNLLEKILADADLLYLGTENFESIGNTLFEELMENKKVKSLKEWNKIQVNFMKNHHYHTDYCIANYTKKKEENLNNVNIWLQNHP